MIDCLSKVIAEYTGELSKADIKETTRVAQEMYSQMVGVEGKSFTEFQKAYMEKLHAYREFAVAERNRKLMDIVKHEQNVGQAARMLEAKDYKGAIHSVFSRTGRWSRTNLEASVNNSITRFSNTLTEFLNEQFPNESKKWTAILKSGEKDMDIARALANKDKNLVKKYDVKDGDAVRLAEAIYKFNNYSLMELRKVGFTLNKREDFIMSMNWNAANVRTIAKTADDFIKIMRQELDIDAFAKSRDLQYKKETMKSVRKLEKMGVPMKDAQAMALGEAIDAELADLYNTLTEKDITANLPKEGTPRAASSFNSLNNRVSRARSLPYKDAESFMRLYQQFGHGTLFAGMYSSLKKNAKIVGRAEIFGTSPDVGFQNFIAHVKRAAKDAGDEATLRELNNRQHEFESRFRHAAGFSEHPADNMVGVVSQAAATITNAAMLGRAGIAALVTDPAYGFSLAGSISDDSMLTRLWAQTHNLRLLLNPKLGKEVAKQMDLLMSDEITDMFTDMLGIDPPIGVNEKLGKASLLMNKVNDTYSKLTLLKGGAYSARRNGARYFAQTVVAKQPKVMEFLGNYGLAESDVDFLIKAGEYDQAELGGYNVISTHKVAELDAVGVKAIIGEMTKEVSSVSIKDGAVVIESKTVPWADIDYLRFKDDKLSKYRQSVYDFAHTSSPTPTKNMMHTLYGSGDTNSVLGATGRLLGVYKSFMFAVYTNVQRAMYQGSNGAKRSFLDGSLGALLVSTTVAGMGALMIKDILQGKTPRDPTRPEFMLEAMDAGGVTGLFGSILLASYAKGKQDPVSDLAGPVVGRMYPDLLDILNKGKRGELEGEDILEKGVRWIPFSNFWATEALLKTYLFDRIKTTINPRFKSGQRSQLEQMSGDFTQQELYLGEAEPF